MAKCPICNKYFKSDACPHSFGQVTAYENEQRIRAIVSEELAKYGLIETKHTKSGKKYYSSDKVAYIK